MPTTRGVRVRSHRPPRWAKISGARATSKRSTTSVWRTASREPRALGGVHARRSLLALRLFHGRARTESLPLAAAAPPDRLELLAAEHFLDLLAVQDLALEERQRQEV